MPSGHFDRSELWRPDCIFVSMFGVVLGLLNNHVRTVGIRSCPLPSRASSFPSNFQVSHRPSTATVSANSTMTKRKSEQPAEENAVAPMAPAGIPPADVEAKPKRNRRQAGQLPSRHSARLQVRNGAYFKASLMPDRITFRVRPALTMTRLIRSSRQRIHRWLNSLSRYVVSPRLLGLS